MRIRALIKNVATGEEREHLDDFDYVDEEGVRQQWREGNFSCDCNRALFFARSAGEEDPEEPPCGDDARFTLRLFDQETGEEVAP